MCPSLLKYLPIYIWFWDIISCHFLITFFSLWKLLLYHHWKIEATVHVSHAWALRYGVTKKDICCNHWTGRSFILPQHIYNLLCKQNHYHHHQQPLQNHKKLYPIQFDIWPILRMAQIFQLDPPGHIGRAPTFYRNHKISMESSVQVHCMSSSMHQKSFLWDYLRSIVCTCSPFKRPLWNIAPFY